MRTRIKHFNKFKCLSSLIIFLCFGIMIYGMVIMDKFLITISIAGLWAMLILNISCDSLDQHHNFFGFGWKEVEE